MFTFLTSLSLWTGLVLAAAAGDDCPVLGPAYPALANPTASSPFFEVAKTQFEDGIVKAFSTGSLSNQTSIFSVQVFSAHADTPIYEYHYVADGAASALTGKSLNNATLYRIGSISKILGVYSILATLSDSHWNDLVTDLVPELAGCQSPDDVDHVQWSEITLGALASQLSGIGRDCKSFTQTF
jgi:CubicO group peptidase (beta-lactamase class C family)